MTGFVFVIVFGLSCLLFQCKGNVFAPSAGTTLTFARRSTESRIEWSFDDKITALTRRIWSFTPTGQSQVLLAIIDGNGPVKKSSNLLEFSIEEPSTLVLKNVNLTYNGTYQFALAPNSGDASSNVVVFVAVTPTLACNCTSPSTVNITDNFACVCTASGGNPPANVAWYKENKKIADSELRLTNVSRDDAGIYRCEAKSHESAINTTEIELIANHPPDNVIFTVTRCGKFAAVTCSAEAQPPATFKIFLNETKMVSAQNTYTIPDVNSNHVGYYTCIAKNILGSKTSNFECLVRLEAPPPTHLSTLSSENAVRTTKKDNETETAPSNTTQSCQTEWYIVLVTLLTGIIIGIFFSYIVFCSRCKFRNNKPQPDFKLQNQVDATYQELDLTKINKEDNYQSLRVNAAASNAAASNDVANGDDSNYTELSKTREVENNYQSLT